MDTRSRDDDDDDDSPSKAFRRARELRDEAKRVTAEGRSALKKRQKLSERTQWREQLKRTQQYLGLRGSRNPTADSMEAVSSDLEDLTVTARAVECNPGLPVHSGIGLLPKNLGPFVIFISIGFEFTESYHKDVAEIGISTLHTEDLLGVQPGA